MWPPVELVSVNHQEICRGHEHMYGDTHGLTGECSKRATRDSFHRRQCWTGASDWWTPVPHLSGNNKSISENHAACLDSCNCSPRRKWGKARHQKLSFDGSLSSTRLARDHRVSKKQSGDLFRYRTGIILKRSHMHSMLWIYIIATNPGSCCAVSCELTLLTAIHLHSVSI